MKDVTDFLLMIFSILCIMSLIILFIAPEPDKDFDMLESTTVESSCYG